MKTTRRITATTMTSSSTGPEPIICKKRRRKVRIKTQNESDDDDNEQPRAIKHDMPSRGQIEVQFYGEQSKARFQSFEELRCCNFQKDLGLDIYEQVNFVDISKYTLFEAAVWQTITKFLERCVNLTGLAMRHNQITDEQVEMLPVLPFVTWLDLSSNCIQNIDVVAKVAPNVRFLDCSDNRIREMPGGLLGQKALLTHVEHLCVYKNFLREIGQNVFVSQEQCRLKALDVARNQLTEDPLELVMCHCPFLEELNCHNNVYNQKQCDIIIID